MRRTLPRASTPSASLRLAGLALALGLLAQAPALGQTARGGRLVPRLGPRGADDPVVATTNWKGRTCAVGRLLVAFEPDAGEAVRQAARARLGARRLAVLGGGYELLQVPDVQPMDAHVSSCTEQPGVRSVQADVYVPVAAPPLTPDDPKVSLQWGLTKVSAFDAWDRGRGAPGIVIAVLDSGVDPGHPDLDDTLAWGVDFFDGDADPTDVHGHGTHCTGLAAAETANGLGIAGAGWGCRYAAYRCGDGGFFTSVLVAAIDDAVAEGAQVLSMSWGSTFDNPAIEDALQRAADAGCVLVAAAGNEGNSDPFYPAAWDTVIGVASSAPNDNPSSFSNRGSWVSVAAPGQSMLSTVPLWQGTGGYGYMSGTSMATPVVAGLAGLLHARLGTARSPATAAAVRAAIEQTSVPLSWVEHGRVDFDAALASLGPAPNPVVQRLLPDNRPALGEHEVLVEGSGLSGATGVSVDGQLLPLEVLDDGLAAFFSPEPDALGQLAVVVHSPGADSAALPLLYTTTDPTDVIVPDVVSVGETFRWRFGGEPDDHWVLLLSFSPTTVPLGHLSVLQDFVVARVGQLDDAGLGEVEAEGPPILAGLTLVSQVLTGPGYVAGASPVAQTFFTP